MFCSVHTFFSTSIALFSLGTCPLGAAIGFLSFQAGLALCLVLLLLLLLGMVVLWGSKNGRSTADKNASVSHLDDHIAINLKQETLRELEGILFYHKQVLKTTIEQSVSATEQEKIVLVEKISGLSQMITQLQGIKTKLEIYLSVRNRLNGKKGFLPSDDPRQGRNPKIDDDE